MDNNLFKDWVNRKIINPEESATFIRFKQRLNSSMDRDKAPTVLQARCLISTIRGAEISGETSKVIDNLEKLLSGKEDRTLLSEKEQTYLQRLKDVYYEN